MNNSYFTKNMKETKVRKGLFCFFTSSPAESEVPTEEYFFIQKILPMSRKYKRMLEY
jgi:hypothetical protein